MPGGGLVSLVAYASQNVILSGNPDMTFFYKTFKKYSHFSLETTTKLLDGITSISYDKSVQLKGRVDRVGDLLTDMYFSFDLPAIFSKYQSINPTTGPLTQQEFQWVRNVGAAAIESVYISVGGTKVQEFTGEYIMAKAKIDYSYDKYEKWRVLVGDLPELYDPANGTYGTKTATGGQYPTVYYDITNPVQTNTPSIPAYTVTVPLPFWFSEEGQAIPLTGLQYHTVDITINLAPARTLYTTLDLSGNRMAPGYRIAPPTQNVQLNIPEFANIDISNTQIKNFLTDISSVLPPLNTWALNPTLHTTYAFLTDDERTKFATTPLAYLVRQVTLVPFNEIIGNQLLQLEVHNPLTRLIFLPRRSDSVLYKNYMTNYTNWWNYPQRPKVYTNVQDDIMLVEKEYASGILVPNSQKDIIQFLRVLANGNEIQELKPITYYTQLTPFKYLGGGANTNIPVFTFELLEPSSQPSGTLNSSAIRKLQIDLQVYPLPTNSSYIYSINVYVENINFFLVESGMGGLKYAL